MLRFASLWQADKSGRTQENTKIKVRKKYCIFWWWCHSWYWMEKKIHLIYYLFEVLIEANLFPVKQARRKWSGEANAARRLLAGPGKPVPTRCLRLHLSLQHQGLEVLLALCFQETQWHCLMATGCLCSVLNSQRLLPAISESRTFRWAQIIR